MNVPKMPTPMMMMNDAHHPSGVRHGVLVPVAHGGDRDDRVPECVGGGRDVRSGCVLLEAEDLQAAELQHEEPHEEQGEQSAARALTDEGPHHRTAADITHQPVDALESEDPQELELGEGQAREEIGPPEAAQEVSAA